jgi:alkylation response protein AidB-like acyl-CoA dehydrogenase
MSQIDQVWGAGPSERYEQLAARFRPIFERIREGAVERELQRKLPYEEIRLLKQAGFGAVRIPTRYGGADATLPELFNLLIELSAADSNVTQAIRAHFGYLEDVLSSTDEKRRARWLPRFASGDLVGSAWSETGPAKVGTFSTKVTKNGKGWVVNGEKFYTTGSLFADWIDVGIDRFDETAGEDKPGSALVARDAPGVTVLDDWDGFGQILTASGTTTFKDARVDQEDVYDDEIRFKYGAAFYQMVHLATLAGIGRAATLDVAKSVAERRRTYTHAAAPRSSQDPQVLQVVGKVRSHAYAAGAIVLKAAESLQRAFDAHFLGDEAADESANAIAELETAQAQTVVSDLILEATTIVFDALGASATFRSAARDRYWRNARTLASHNPRIYKDRIIGDYAVNGTAPPYQWRIGQVG